MNLEAVLEKAATARPGYTLASFKEAALPHFLLTARILVVEKKPLSPIEEGCVRAVDAGLQFPEDIGAFLGLPRPVLTGVLAALNARECINYQRAVGDDAAKVSLTDKGRLSLTEARSVTPQEKLIKLVFDPLLKRISHVSSGALFKPREVKDAGWLEVPLCGAKRPEVEDISVTDLDKAVERMRTREEETCELLALRRIERREMLFLPCVLLYYKSSGSNEVQVAIYREDGFSLEHENAFRDLGGPQQVGVEHVLAPFAVPTVPDVPDGPSLGAAVGELVRAEASASAAPTAGSASGGEPGGGAKDTASSAASVVKRAMTQRLVRCHEHPALLRKALTTATSRLLIVSPWITHQVVDRMFYASMEALLRNGVEVSIGYGLADEADGGLLGAGMAKQKPPITVPAQRDLEDIQRRFQNFSLRFLGNTHRKHLVCDNKFAVVTSFNWLSFRGDPKQKARDELGFLVTEPADVERLFQDGAELLNKGYDHPRSIPKGTGNRA